MRVALVGALAAIVMSCGSDGGDVPSNRSARTVPTTTPPPAPTRKPTTDLEALQLGVVGRWVGEATAADGALEPSSWSLWLDLHEDGHYEAGCLGELCKAAFPHGSDRSSPSKRYAIFDLDRTGIGEIYVFRVADEGAPEYMQWTVRAEMENVELTPDGNRLTFALHQNAESTEWLVRFDLRRVRL